MTDPRPPQPPPRPAWVTRSAIAAAVVVAVIVVVALLSDGAHGPGRHLPGGDPRNHTPPVEHVP